MAHHFAESPSIAVVMTGVNQQPISLTGSVVGPHALRHVPDLRGVQSGGAEELLIEARGMTGADAFTAVAIRAVIERHLASDADATVCPWFPRDPACRRRLHYLLGALPERCALPDDYRVPRRDPRILIPALAVVDIDEAELIGRTIRAAGSSSHLGNLRLAVAHAQFLAVSAVALLDNALTYASDSGCAPIISCAIEAESRDVQLVVYDLGERVATNAHSLARLRESLDRSRANFGGLTNVLDLARRHGFEASMVIRSGTAFARWDGSWETREVAYSPGWGTGITVDRSHHSS